MKIFSRLMRFALAETAAMSFFLGLEALAYGVMLLVRHVHPGAGDAYLININYFWKLMAFSGLAVALIFGGPCYLLCARFMQSTRLPYWIAGTVIILGGTLFFAINLNEAFSGGCGG